MKFYLKFFYGDDFVVYGDEGVGEKYGCGDLSSLHT